MCAFRLINKLEWTDVLKKLLALNTVVQYGDKDGLIQLNPQRSFLLKDSYLH